jgi:hypothetical protein
MQSPYFDLKILGALGLTGEDGGELAGETALFRQNI